MLIFLITFYFKVDFIIKMLYDHYQVSFDSLCNQ